MVHEKICLFIFWAILLQVCQEMAPVFLREGMGDDRGTLDRNTLTYTSKQMILIRSVLLIGEK